MPWFILAILTAVSNSLADAYSKFSLKRCDVWSVAWAARFFSVLLVVPAALWDGIPSLSESFWWALLVSGIINFITTIWYMKAIDSGDISLSVPMISFTPLFMLITSPLIIGEFPQWQGILGIVAIVAGAYTINLQNGHSGILQPFKALWRAKGPRYMLLVAFAWSITANIDKIGVEGSSPFFWAASVSFFMTVFLTLALVFRRKLSFIPDSKHDKNLVKESIESWKYFAPLGLFAGLVLLFQMTAIQYTVVAYVIAIKRSGILLSVLWGLIFFKEGVTFTRFSGAALMVAGAVIIILFS